MASKVPLNLSFTHVRRFLFDYLRHSPDKKKVRLLFAGSILCVLAFVALGLPLGWYCFSKLNAAIIAKDTVLLLTSIGSGLVISAGMAGFYYLANYFKNQLYIDWRSWLTKNLINQYLYNKTNYLKISRIYKKLDNPEQRIQEDVDKAISSFLDLALGFVDNASNLVVFTLLLCLAGGSLSITVFGFPLIIPGYLVLVAFAAGLSTSYIGYCLNKSLSFLTNEETKAQSNLRVDLQQLKSSAEEIAIEHAEAYYQNRLSKEVDELKTKSLHKLTVQNNTLTFNTFNTIVQNFIPYLAAAPLFFNDLLSLDVFFSVGFYFSSITRSLNWFIDSFEKINVFKTSLGRIMTLQHILAKNHATSTKTIIRTLTSAHEPIVVNDLTLRLEHEDKLVVKGLEVKFTPGVHTLIQARSGTGKSSLFKAIAGTWVAGEGEIILPNNLQSIYFLPQKPTLPHDTLRTILCYPNADCPYTDEELSAALKAVNMGELATQLNEHVGFKSLGEQQRIAFARILLRKPDWLFLDEATASLDEELEEQMYKLIKERSPKTTIVSIAHRSTVRQHHDHVFFFKLNENKEVAMEQYPVLAKAS